MNKSTELKHTNEIVKDILERCPEARNSDDVLFALVCEKVNVVAANMPFKKVWLERKNLNIPAFETVRRTRQKLQAEHPELAAAANVEAARGMNEGIFKEFARR